MSVLHHEAILENCFEVAYEDFRIENNYSKDRMEELYLMNKNIQNRLEEVATQMFEDLCQ
jgi:hypothetical protein|tara:strand:+ start:589 stop:768 length:180 start_codon:yes stop_codon:yes gene_type:complete